MILAAVPEYWWPFIYQYGVGAIIFFVGLIVILRQGSCVLSRERDRFWFIVLLAGFVLYVGVHFLWYQVAIHLLPAEGVVS